MLSLWLMQDRPYADERRLAAAVVRALGHAALANPVRVRMLAWRQAWTAIREGLFDDSLPDILEVGSTWMASLVEMGAVLPRPDQVAGRGMRVPFGHMGGWAVPWTWDVRLLYVRRSLLAQAGVSLASLATWSGLEEACRQVTRRGVAEAMALPGQAEPALVHTLLLWVWAHGGDAVGILHRWGLHPDEPGFQGLVAFLSWAHQGLFSPSTLEKDLVDAYQEFRKGRCAFALASTTGPAASLQDDPDVALLPIPMGHHGEATSYEGGTYLTVTADSRDPQASWDAIQSILSLTRADRTRHFWTTRRLLARAWREGEGGAPYRRRLRRIPDVPHWAALEARLAQRVSDWLAMAAHGSLSQAVRQAREEAEQWETWMAL